MEVAMKTKLDDKNYTKVHCISWLKISQVKLELELEKRSD